jgi:hypothetical protein
LIAVVTTSVKLSVVVCTVLVQPPGPDHATLSDVVYSGKRIVIGVGSTSGGRLKVHG